MAGFSPQGSGRNERLDGDPIERLVYYLSRLPGIGEKTASRLAFFLLRASDDYVRSLAQSLIAVKEQIRLCEACCNLTEASPCAICGDARRDHSTICVVEQPSDVQAFERGRDYRGLYHILHGSLSPLDGVGPDQLKISELLRRLENEGVEEIILATNPNVEGDATALFLARTLRPLGVKTTRIAYGIPVGSELEYVDRVTLQRALENRREM